MFNKSVSINQKNLLLLLYVIILGIFGPAIYWISNANTGLFAIKKSDSSSIQERLSAGDKILVTAKSSSAKKLGTEAFAKGNYLVAQEQFTTSLESEPNDPETRIYLNNTLAAKTKNPHKIGLSVPIGGNLNVAQEILRGVAQAQLEINKNGGVKGNPVVVHIANDDNDTDTALEIADKFVRDEKIAAVIGHNSSNISLAAAPIYQDGQVVMITPTSSAENLPKVGDYIFRATPSTRNLAQPLADHAVNTLGKTNIAICVDSASESIQSFKDEFTWSVFNYGAKIAQVECDFSADDFVAAEIPSKVISHGADALLLAPSLKRTDDAIAVAQASQSRLPLLGSHTLNAYSTLKDGQNATKGMTLAVAWNPLVNTQNDFTTDTKKLWGGLVSWRTAMAYDAAKTVFAGMQTKSSRTGLQQTLKNPHFKANGASSNISFLPSGDRNLTGTLIQVQPGKRSGTGFDFVPLVTEEKSLKFVPLVIEEKSLKSDQTKPKIRHHKPPTINQIGK